MTTVEIEPILTFKKGPRMYALLVRDITKNDANIGPHNQRWAWPSDIANVMERFSDTLSWSLAEKEKEKDAEITSLKATIERLERESDSLFRDACVAVRILMTEAYETAKSKGWHEEPKKTIPEAIALMHSELSEALEEYRKSPPLGVEKGIYSGAGGKPEGIAVEFADVVIRIFDTCQAEGFDLPKALRQKMEYNKTREHRHGGKKI